MVVGAVRTAVIYILLIAAMRIMGKRQLSELQPSELAVTMMIADMAVIPMQEVGIPLLFGVIPILVLLSLEVLLSGAMLKLPFLSRLVSGNPLIVIRNGTIDPKVLRRMRMSVEDLMESLRSQNVFDLREVAYAIAETNGSISVLTKPAHRPVTCADLSLSPEDNGLPSVVISDGRLCREAFSLCGITEAWVEKVLRKKHCSLKDVLVMTCDASHRYLIVDKKGKTL